VAECRVSELTSWRAVYLGSAWIPVSLWIRRFGAWNPLSPATPPNWPFCIRPVASDLIHGFTSTTMSLPTPHSKASRRFNASTTSMGTTS